MKHLGICSLLTKRSFALIVFAIFLVFMGTACSKLDPSSVPSPIAEVKSAEEANTLTGFSVKLPSVLPFEATDTKFIVIGNETTSVVYSGADKKILTYRMGKTVSDNSGMYVKYSINKKEDISGLKVTLKGDSEDQYAVAFWTDGRYSYSVSVDQTTFTKDELVKLIDSLK